MNVTKEPAPSPTEGLEVGARVPDPLHPPRPFGDDEPPSTWWRKHFLALCLGTFCTAAAVLVVQQVGWKGLVGFSPQSTIPPSVLARDKAAVAQFTPVVDHIYAVTNEAFRERNPALLATVYASTCQCLAQGNSYINQLVADHQVLGGSGSVVKSIQVYEVKPTAVLLGVTDYVAPFPIYNDQGAEVAQSPGRDPTTFTMDLELTSGNVWKVSDVVLVDNALP